MNKRNGERFLRCVSLAIAMGLLAGQSVAVAETGKTAVRDAAVKKAGGAKKAQSGACVSESNKKWRDGQHCMSSCNEQGSLCDMRICKSGSWKPYSSCFGPKSAAPNCPASCG